MKANSISEFATLLRDASPPGSPKEQSEFLTIKSWAFSPIFGESFRDLGPFEFCRGSDPPDFVVTTSNTKIAIEVTTFTAPQFEVFSRERTGPGSFTSTLRTGKPDREFWGQLRDGTLPDDSAVVPHFEGMTDLDADYATAAAAVVQQKLNDLLGYGVGYSKCILLVYDRLSTFRSDWERRLPVLRSVVTRLASQAEFSEIILVDGNRYPTETAIRV